MNDLVIKAPAVIECDFEAIEKFLNEQLDIYRNMVFTEDAKADAKKTVAELRKQKKAFSDRIEEVKEEYMAPFNEFMAKANRIIAMYDEPVEFINNQITEFERRRVEEKQKRIAEIYSEFMTDMEQLLPLKDNYNLKWENATYSEKQIKDDVCSLKHTVKTGIETIKAMNTDIEDRVIKRFIEDKDLQKAMMTITSHEREKAEILAREQERLRKAEEERIRREEREKIEAELRHQRELEQAKLEAELKHQEELEKVKQEAEQAVIDSFIPEQSNEVSAIYEYHITLTDSEKEKLEMYMDSVGIEYEVNPRF